VGVAASRLGGAASLFTQLDLNRKLHLVNELHNMDEIALLPHSQASSFSIEAKS
jgi:hypothetical protein